MTDQLEGNTAYRDDIALGYDEARMDEPLWGVEQNFIKEFVASLPSSSLVLDIPFGTGRFADFYFEKNLRAIGIDISVDMLKVARSKAASRENSIELIRGDARCLPLPDNTADIVICFRLAHLVSPAALYPILRELKRVAKHRVVLEIVGVDLGFPSNAKKRFFSLLGYMSRVLRRVLSRNRKPWENIRAYVHSVSVLRRCFASLGLSETCATRIADYNGWPVIVYYLDK